MEGAMAEQARDVASLQAQLLRAQSDLAEVRKSHGTA